MERHKLVDYDDRNVRNIEDMLRALKFDSERSIPMYKWDARFSGDGQGYSLNEFIKRAERFSNDENMSRRKLVINIHKLLDGVARKWYWASVDEWESWDEFVYAIRSHFLPKNYRFFLREEIDTRLQAQNEQFTSFITDMKILFQKADPSLSEEDKLYIVQKNMLPHYSEPLSTHNVYNLNDLIALCKRVDENQIMRARRMASNNFVNYPLVEPSCFPAQSLKSRCSNFPNRQVHSVESYCLPSNYLTKDSSFDRNVA